jgi:hypothetical protein
MHVADTSRLKINSRGKKMESKSRKQKKMESKSRKQI